MMFDVINNMVQEMSMLKHSIQVGGDLTMK